MLKRDPIPMQTTREGQRLAYDHGRRYDHERTQHDAERRLAKSDTGIDDITIAAGGTKKIFHRLGRQPRGWRVVDKNKAGDVWRTAWNEETITLATDAAGAITLRVEVF